MTAVASPPSLQSVPRLGWYSSSNGGQGPASSTGTEEVSRIYMPRKSLQRTNSSSSISSTSSSLSTSTISVASSNGSQPTNGESAPGAIQQPKKKPPRYIWSSSKAEPVSGVTNARPQTVSAPPSGTTATSAMSALHQAPPAVPLQHASQIGQQNGLRLGNPPFQNEPHPILTLLPLNATFEKKQIAVPYFPEVLRVGRQTNAKTVPTPMNGYFDSKVLSRQHAEVWADRQGRIWIRDVKSSNGTFVNGQRLSPENRDSEPHELREQDTLELGIDILSEDQKSIVHHKVSAKVEHAGVYPPNMNVLDLNFGDIDPTSSGRLFPSHMNQPYSHMRGRAGSSASMGSNRSSQFAAGSHLQALHQQRQMNYWVSPISIEQVVKRLSTEMKQAKQHNHDLSQTSDFLTLLIAGGGQEAAAENSQLKLSPTESNNHGNQISGVRSRLPKVENISRFSEPPAPPPQHPLPEKPDLPPPSASLSEPILNSQLKRFDTEKPKIASGSSSLSQESSQILSLIEALTTARRELESQGARVKELEDLLCRERTARESAEDTVRTLEGKIGKTSNPEYDVETMISEPPTEVAEAESSATDGSIATEPLGDDNDKSANETSGTQITTGGTTPEVASQLLHRRLESMMADMDEMRKQVEKYRASAERAEKDASQSRRTLADMIEKARQRDQAETSTSPPRTKANTNAWNDTEGSSKSLDSDDKVPLPSLAAFDRTKATPPPDDPALRTGDYDSSSSTTTFAIPRYRGYILEQSAPYASMLGVVLLGVGIMAYLNGWQRGDKS